MNWTDITDGGVYGKTGRLEDGSTGGAGPVVSMFVFLWYIVYSSEDSQLRSKHNV
jgi:hypothetical protein